tara:strand:- start:5 stop:385 length:381 start_codon:yes stop_codon:yes gene_type:complete
MIQRVILITTMLFPLTITAGSGDIYYCEVHLSAWINKDTVLKSPAGINGENFQFRWQKNEIKIKKVGVETAEFILEENLPIIKQSEFDVFARGEKTLIHFDKSTLRMFISVQSFDDISSAMAKCRR